MAVQGPAREVGDREQRPAGANMHRGDGQALMVERQRHLRTPDATAVDEDTLLITLEQPDPALLTYLSQNSGLVAAASTFDAADAQTNPVGSGPPDEGENDRGRGPAHP